MAIVATGREMTASRPHLLRHLRLFCVAARALSFKDAALALHLTPSAVSHQVKSLEAQLGVQLFERRTRSLALTDAGRRLLAEVEPQLNELDGVLARFAGKPPRQALRVTLPPFFASELFVPRLTSFYRAAPDVDIHLSTQDPRPVEHPASADVSVLLAETAPTEVDAHELFSLRLVAGCARSIARRVRESGNGALLEQALIVHRSRADAWAEWAAAAGVDPPDGGKVIELDSMYAVVRAAERGLGIALVPASLTSHWFDSGALEQVSAVELPTRDRYFLVNRAVDGARPEVQALRAWALAEFRDA